MFAVIKTGGKQYKVAKDDVIRIERLTVEAGSKVDFEEVLAVGEKIGTPTVAGAKVIGEVVENARNAKVVIFKKRRRHNYRRKKGHKQHVSVVKILDIVG
ncbi:MAG: 50S ribosomal protein L21 [Alphaproteobacteria bacterium ADurb.Bin438]|nr:MAG: 50S ribosomal protein L21 [Alphaproteobacteria bacterium ADurb.Bin438]